VESRKIRTLNNTKEKKIKEKGEKNRVKWGGPKKAIGLGESNSLLTSLTTTEGSDHNFHREIWEGVYHRDEKDAKVRALGERGKRAVRHFIVKIVPVEVS